MKSLLYFFLFFILIQHTHSQDILYKKSGGGISCKVLEIKVDVIKYKRPDLKRSPIYEINKVDVYKVKYKGGNIDIIDPIYNKQKPDTADYSIIYVVYNDKKSNEVFPLYLNGRHICKLKGHSRLTLKTRLEDIITFYRDDLIVVGPICKLIAIHGQNYAINILVDNVNTNKTPEKFSLTVYEDSEDVNTFIKDEYNGFNPDKDHDFRFVEK